MSKDVLIVDDEAAIREVVGAILEDEGYRPRGAAEQRRGAARDRAPRRRAWSCSTSGSRAARSTACRSSSGSRPRNPDIPVIMFSGHGTIETAVAAIKKGAYDFIEKPFKSDRLLLAIQRALEASRLRREVPELRNLAFDEAELIGNAPAMIRVRQAIERVAPTGSRVLISGPPGSGKEVAARLIHAKSRRAGGPFVDPQRRGAGARAGRHRAVRRRGRAGWRRTSRGWSARSSAPTAARCCSTRWPTCRWRRRARSCASCRSSASRGWAATTGSRSTCA